MAGGIAPPRQRAPRQGRFKKWHSLPPHNDSFLHYRPMRSSESSPRLVLATRVVGRNRLCDPSRAHSAVSFPARTPFNNLSGTEHSHAGTGVVASGLELAATRRPQRLVRRSVACVRNRLCDPSRAHVACSPLRRVTCFSTSSAPVRGRGHVVVSMRCALRLRGEGGRASLL